MGSDRRDRQRDCTLVQVSWWEIPEYWPKVSKWINQALIRGFCLNHTLETVYSACLNGSMTLWVAEADEVRGCAITRIHQNRYRVCEMFVIGGESARDWMPLEKGISDYAKSMGCHFMEGSGRKGWGRAAPDYKEVYTVFRKEL